MTISPNKRPTVIKGHSQSSYLWQNPCLYLTQTKPKVIIICQFISVLWNIESVCMFMFTKYIIYIKDSVHALLLRSVWFFMTPWLQPTRLFCPLNFPGKNTGLGYQFLLQRIFLTQGSNPGLLHCGQILYHLWVNLGLNKSCLLVQDNSRNALLILLPHTTQNAFFHSLKADLQEIPIWIEVNVCW